MGNVHQRWAQSFKITSLFSLDEIANNLLYTSSFKTVSIVAFVIIVAVKGKYKV
jgi:hypothetical protein